MEPSPSVNPQRESASELEEHRARLEREILDKIVLARAMAMSVSTRTTAIR